MDISKALIYYRKKLHLTQNDLAAKANINEKYYGRLERNESSPTINMLEQICNALNISLADFLYKASEFNNFN